MSCPECEEDRAWREAGREFTRWGVRLLALAAVLVAAQGVLIYAGAHSLRDVIGGAGLGAVTSTGLVLWAMGRRLR